MRKLIFLAAFAGSIVASSPAFVVYENLSTAATAGYSELNTNNPIFGDSLDMLQGGTMSIFGASLFNSTSGGNTGTIMKGDMLVKFYDNTVPYVGGALSNPLLGQATMTWDFTGSGGLAAGFYSTGTVNLTPLNIVVTQHILVTQQFTETQGDSLRNGVVLFGAPTVGSSPNTVYIKSSATSEGLYTFTGNPGQFGYHIELVPEPASIAVIGLGLLGLVYRRRRR